MMSDTPEQELTESLTRPVTTLGHEIRNQLHAALGRMAIISNDQKHLAEQGGRIERSVLDVAVRVDNMDRRVTELEKQILVRVSLLEQKIGPIEKLVYGLVSLVLMSVLGGILMLVLRNNP